MMHGAYNVRFLNIFIIFTIHHSESRDHLGQVISGVSVLLFCPAFLSHAHDVTGMTVIADNLSND